MDLVQGGLKGVGWGVGDKGISVSLWRVGAELGWIGLWVWNKSGWSYFFNVVYYLYICMIISADDMILFVVMINAV